MTNHLPDKLPHDVAPNQQRVNDRVVNQFQAGVNRLALTAVFESENYDPVNGAGFRLGGDGTNQLAEVFSRFGISGGLVGTPYELMLQRHGGRLMDHFRAVAGIGNLGEGRPGMSGALAGSGYLDDAATELQWQLDYKSVTFAAGAATVNFPTAFPHGLLWAMAQNADGGSFMLLAVDFTTCTTAHLGLKAYDVVGAVNYTGTRAINYLALGW